MNKKKTKTKIIILVLLCFLIVIGGIFAFIFMNLDVTAEYKNSDSVVFTVDEGSYGRETLQKLEDENIIKNADITYLYSKFFLDLNFVSGDYVIPGHMSHDEVINYLCNDKNVIQNTVSVTIVEGSFALDFAKEIAKNTDLDADELVSYWNNEAFIRQLMNDYPFLTEDIFDDDIKISLEGYLFPSTYEFFANTNYEEVTRKLLDKTNDIYKKYRIYFDNTPEFYHYDDDEYRHASIHEIFTLASILQWESGTSSEMDKIASVFYNRLNSPEILASTVTACYSAGLSKQECAESGDNFEYTMLEDNYTYNTYTKQGLPVGPVLSPGEDAIFAALCPATTDYFYFVGDTCGGTGTIFAKTWDEHEYNIEKYVNCNID
ncbi:MAG: endolytic transglycosylase MltG [Firmicutes bacterium]|nr:endolytic transglycosylase MltG [Candidatus Colivicinus equi]